MVMPPTRVLQSPRQPAHAPANPDIEAWVLACLRYHLGTGDLPEVGTLSAITEFDLNSLIAYAREQRVAPLLYQALRGRGFLPDRLATEFQQAYRSTSQANLFLLHAFRQVLQSLTAAGISVIVGKGPLFINQIYGDPALRPFSDLDLFIRLKDIPAAVECLKQLGFKTEAEPYLKRALEFEKEILFTKPGILEVLVDLHWSLLGPAYYRDHVPQDWLWELTMPARVADVQVSSWRLEVQIVYLACHLVLMHPGQDRCLLWWYDLAALIQTNRETIQWDAILDYSQRLQVILPVRDSFQILASRWMIPIPKSVLGQLLRLQPTPNETWLYHWRQEPAVSYAQRWWESIRTMKGNHRMQFIMLYLFPPPALARRMISSAKPLPLLYLSYWLTGIKLVFFLLVQLTKTIRLKKG